MRIKEVKEQTPLIGLDEDKCTNCLACISACPVKFCIDGSGDKLEINHNLCIGCGKCIERCTHDARTALDDIDVLDEVVLKGGKAIVLVAPSIVSNFPKQYLKINGWLKEQGIPAFDVSFGAELTVKSLEEYIKNNPDKNGIISSACPSIVNFVEVCAPELISNLAPVDTPIVHTIKMVRNCFPQYNDCTIFVLTPCIAKKREYLDSVGEQVFNIGFSSLEKYFYSNCIDLNDYSSVDYQGPKSERGSIFPTPRGLLTTLERPVPNASEFTRQIEGADNIYNYLEELADREVGSPKKLIDCLNCGDGCNKGPLSIIKDTPIDVVEDAVESKTKSNIRLNGHTLENDINNSWEPGIYDRVFSDKSNNNKLIYPSVDKIKEIYQTMDKFEKSDLKDCDACGYGLCENMAIAIHNGLNKPENCHFYLSKLKDDGLQKILKDDNRLLNVLQLSDTAYCVANSDMVNIMVNKSLSNLLKTPIEKLNNTKVFQKQLESGKSDLRFKIPSGLVIEMHIHKEDDLFICNFK
jgi:iron only hydrogenase large subunit-like protein